MATATAYTSFNSDTFAIADGTATIYTDTHIRVVDGSQVFDYYGSGFAYDMYGDVVGGTLNSIEHSINGAPQYEVTGLAHSASTFNDFLQANDEQGLLAYLFNGNDSLTGSSGSDVVNSYAGNDFISGGSGNDVGRGGVGNDTIIGGAGNDTMIGGTGIDTVSYQTGATSGVTVSLAVAGVQVTGGAGNDTLSDVERLTGSGFADKLTGNGGQNLIKGLSGGDTLSGRSGNDILTGAGGADKFLFNATLNAASNVDRITDFSAADDVIRLDNDIFLGLATGTLASGAFYKAPGAAAALDAGDRIIYNSTSGDLYFDADGMGGAAARLFATLTTHPVITVADFFIVN